MSKLKEILMQFENDENWNTPQKDGAKRFDKEIKWIESMINQYAARLEMTPDEVATNFEEKRNYSWPNYYQEANFPNLDTCESILFFETLQEFKERELEFECPNCNTISKHPQECLHRIENDGICDWCSYGLFKSSFRIVIKEDSLVPIPVFKPVL